jgi:hypothetical protein
MKTTIELPDALAQEAKALAHVQGVTLRELVVEGLRSELDRRSRSNTRVDFQFPTFGGDGLRPGVEWADLVELSYDESSPQGQHA